MALRVVLIGAAGVFGSRIASQLAGDPRFHLTLAGRRITSLAILRDRLGDASVQLAVLDVTAPGLVDVIAALRPQLVIHAAGPFQQQDYRGAMPCMGLFTLDEALFALDGFAIETQLEMFTG
jgi:saccharopine dehydrogenase-like NADP-dependent oxidoreductase